MPDDDAADAPKLRSPTAPQRRLQSQTERDVSGMAAKRERDSREVRAVEHIEEEVTGNHEGDELREIRSRRAPSQRMEHLEDRVDAIVTTIGDWRGEVADQMGSLSGEVKGLAGEVKGLATVVTNSVQRDHVTFKASVDVGTAQQIDLVDGRKARREWVTQLLKIAASAVAGAIALGTALLAAGRC